MPLSSSQLLQNSSKSTHIDVCLKVDFLIKQGRFSEAFDALCPYWSDINSEPAIENCSPDIAAEVLFKCGRVASCLGNIEQSGSNQARAKDLLTKSLELFRELNNINKIVEVEVAIGQCYQREGATEEALVWLESAIGHTTDKTSQGFLAALISYGINLIRLGENKAALRHFLSIENYYQDCDEYLAGCYFNELCICLRDDKQYKKSTDAGIRAYNLFVKAGNDRFALYALQSIAFTATESRDFSRAIEFFEELKQKYSLGEDKYLIANIAETEARLYYAKGDFEKAGESVNLAIEILEQSDDAALLTESITTRAKIRLKLNLVAQSFLDISRAIHIAYNKINGTAATKIIDEFQSHFYLLQDLPFADEVHAFEAKLISEALTAENRKVYRAAKRLGFKNHQTLFDMLKNRHKNLLDSNALKSEQKEIRLKPKEISQPVTAESETLITVNPDSLLFAVTNDSPCFESCLQISSNRFAHLGPYRGDILLLCSCEPDISGLAAIETCDGEIYIGWLIRSEGAFGLEMGTGLDPIIFMQEDITTIYKVTAYSDYETDKNSYLIVKPLTP